MINETSESPFPASSSAASTASGMSGGSYPGSGAASPGASHDSVGAQAHTAVHRMAQAAHEAVDRLEQTLGVGSERMLDWQQAYGEMARDQVRNNPLAAVGIAFGVGILFSKLFMR